VSSTSIDFAYLAGATPEQEYPSLATAAVRLRRGAYAHQISFAEETSTAAVRDTLSKTKPTVPPFIPAFTEETPTAAVRLRQGAYEQEAPTAAVRLRQGAYEQETPTAAVRLRRGDSYLLDAEPDMPAFGWSPLLFLQLLSGLLAMLLIVPFNLLKAILGDTSNTGHNIRLAVLLGSAPLPCSPPSKSWSCQPHLLRPSARLCISANRTGEARHLPTSNGVPILGPTVSLPTTVLTSFQRPSLTSIPRWEWATGQSHATSKALS